jgi:hypothetical protein
MGFFFTGDRGFESTFLQRRVSNEPCGCRGRRTRVGPRVRIRFAPAGSHVRTGREYDCVTGPIDLIGLHVCLVRSQPFRRRRAETLSKALNQLSAMIGLRKTPMPPSISTSTTSPGFIHKGGLRAKPTPSGVPVDITSLRRAARTLAKSRRPDRAVPRPRHVVAPPVRPPPHLGPAPPPPDRRWRPAL